MYRPKEIPRNCEAAARRMFQSLEEGQPLYGSIHEALFVPISEHFGSLIVLDQLSEIVFELLCAVQPCLREETEAEHDTLTVEERVAAVKAAVKAVDDEFAWRFPPGTFWLKK